MTRIAQLEVRNRRHCDAKRAIDVDRRGTREIETWWYFHNGIERAGVDFVYEDGSSSSDARARALTGYAKFITLGFDLKIARLHSTQLETDNEITRRSDEDVGVGNPTRSPRRGMVRDALGHWFERWFVCTISSRRTGVKRGRRSEGRCRNCLTTQPHFPLLPIV
jgi:hypothetical protein